MRCGGRRAGPGARQVRRPAPILVVLTLAPILGAARRHELIRGSPDALALTLLPLRSNLGHTSAETSLARRSTLINGPDVHLGPYKLGQGASLSTLYRTMASYGRNALALRRSDGHG